MATTHALPDTDRIDRRDLKKYPKEVQDLLMELVNRYHVGFKHKDGTHLFLYSPDGISRPRKVSASRGGPQQVELLLKWAKEHLNRDIVHQNDVAALAQALNSPEHSPQLQIDHHAAKTLGRRIPVTAPEPEAPEPTYDDLQKLVEPGWTRHFKGSGTTRKPSIFETNGQHFRCLKCLSEGVSKAEATVESVKLLGSHSRVKHSVGFDHLRDPEVRARSAAKRAETVARQKAEKEKAEKAEKAAEQEAAEQVVPALAAVPDTGEIDTTGWEPYLEDGAASGWLIKGEEYMCLACLAAGQRSVVSGDKRARTGHKRFKHDKNPGLAGNKVRAANKATKPKAVKGTHPVVEKAAPQDAAAKRQNTRQINKMSAKIEAAMVLLAEGLEVTVDKDALKASERRIKELEKEVARAEKERDAAISRAEEIETKFALAREAFSL